MKKTLSLILAIMLLGAIVPASAFGETANPELELIRYENHEIYSDVPDDLWASVAINALSDKHILNGYENSTFRPDNTVSRAEWAKMLTLISGVMPPRYYAHAALPCFGDVSETHWYYEYVNAVAVFMNHYDYPYPSEFEIAFHPEDVALREDIAVSLIKLMGYDISKADLSVLGRFSDAGEISQAAKPYIAVAVSERLINGFEDGTFRGKSTLTRAEAATVLWRAFEHDGELGGLGLGSSDSDILRVLGEPESKSEVIFAQYDARYHQQWLYPAQGIVVEIAWRENGKSVCYISVESPYELSLNREVKIGSTLEEVLNAYHPSSFQDEKNNIHQIFYNKDGEKISATYQNFDAESISVEWISMYYIYGLFLYIRFENNVVSGIVLSAGD